MAKSQSEKLKALDQALDIVNKALKTDSGDPLIAKLGDNPRKVETISSGSLVLDAALGGGLAKGRIIEIMGPESSGKCLDKDAMVYTSEGLLTMEEIFNHCDQPASCTSRVTDVSEYGLYVLNENSEMERVKALTHNNRRKTRKITLKDGRSEIATPKHPVRVLEDGYIVWKYFDELQVGDVVVSMLGGVEKIEGIDLISEEAATLLGYLVSERSTYDDFFSIAEREDESVLTEVKKVILKFVNESVKGSGDSLELLESDLTSLKKDLFRLGISYGELSDEYIQSLVRRSSEKVQINFLSALFEADSWVEKTGEVAYSSISKRLVEEVQLMLRGFGITSTLSERVSETFDTTSWVLNLSSMGTTLFLARIGFGSDNRDDLNSKFSKASEEILRELRELQNNYTFDEIISVEENGKIPTFDLVLEETHSFVANGIINHNTSIALTAVGNVQREGGVAAFIDLENALDPVYAGKLGVDIPNLALSQPDNAEQALDLVEALIQTGVVDIIIIDSIAALVTKAELEGSMADHNVAGVARLMSKILRKIVKPASDSNTTVVFINQLRDKVGVIFGSPEITTGGNAMKFYSSQRIDIRRRGQEKEDGEIIGTRIKVKVIKNKIGPPFREGETILTFDKGINKAAELLETGEKYGVITKPNPRGRTYVETETGEIISSQSQSAAIEAIEEDEELFNRLTEKLSKILKGEDLDEDEEVVKVEEEEE